jgi:hypothetical protein
LDFVERKLLPVIHKLSKDSISNIRMNAAVVLKKLSTMTKTKEVISEVNSLLDELKKDTDIDVQNAAIDII